jgi:hypothetical protein
MIDASTLVASTSQVSSDEEYDEFLTQVVPPPFLPALTLLQKRLGDDLRVTVVDPHFGLTGRLQGEGLVQILRTILKYIPQ